MHRRKVRAQEIRSGTHATHHPPPTTHLGEGGAEVEEAGAARTSASGARSASAKSGIGVTSGAARKKRHGCHAWRATKSRFAGERKSSSWRWLAKSRLWSDDAPAYIHVCTRGDSSEW